METVAIFRTTNYAVLSTNTSSNINPLISKDKSVKVYLTSFFEAELLLWRGEGNIRTSAVAKWLARFLRNPTALLAGGHSYIYIYIFVFWIQFNSLNYSH